MRIVVSVLFCIVSFVSASGDRRTKTVSPECDSFYDYVCAMEGERYGAMSYFEILRDRHVRTVRNVIHKEPFFSSCLKRYDSNVSSSLARLLSESADSKEDKERVRTNKRGVSSVIPASFYSTFLTSENIAKNGIGFEYPVKAQVVKRLDSSETCLDLSPNLKWLNAAYEAVDKNLLQRIVPNDDKTISRLLSDFVRKLKDAFELSTARMDKESSTESYALDSYMKAYTTVDGYYESMQRTIAVRPERLAKEGEGTNVRFWKDVLMNMYDLKDGSFCLHANGYEKYYDVVEKYASFKTQEYEFSDVIEAFSDDLKFGRYDDNDYRENGGAILDKTKRCEKMTRKAVPTRINDAFMELSGARKAYETDFSVERMLEELKSAINDTVGKSAHVSKELKTYVTEKLNRLKTFVLNKIPEKGEDVASSSCLMGGWNEVVSCLSERKMEEERTLVRKSLSNRRRDYNAIMNEKERAKYLYDNTDVSIVNAWYDPTKNEITIPAGIVFYPMYVGTAFETNDMFDYSRMGMILAHELGHSIDANGLCWDAKGNYDVTKRYCSENALPPLVKNNMACLMEDYGHPCSDADDYGHRTLGEDMADQLGVVAAWKVFKSNYEREIRKEDEREFFRRYAQLWCEGKHPKNEQERAIAKPISTATTEGNNEEYGNLDRKSSLPFALEMLKISKKFKTRANGKTLTERQQHGKGVVAAAAAAAAAATAATATSGESWMCDRVMRDVHALPKHRVNKTLRQLTTFSETFECKKGDAMVKETPCVVY